MTQLFSKPLPGDWVWARLGDICEINPSLSSDEIPLPAAKVTFVPMAAVDEVNGEIAYPEERLYREVSRGFTPFRNGDVLFAKITPSMENGKAAIARKLISGLGFGSTEFHILRPKSIVLAEWIFYFIRQDVFRKFAQQRFTGSAGQQRVPADVLENVQIPLPSLPEQQRVVDILSHAADLYRQRSEVENLAQKFIFALFDKMFAHNIKAENINSLGNFVQEFRYGTSNKSSPEGKPVLRIPNVLNEILDLKDLKTVVVSDDDFERLRLQEGDILFVRSNGNPEYVGRSAVFETAVVKKTGLDPENFIYASYLIRARLLPEKINPYFLQYYLASAKGRMELRRRTRTSAGQYNINTEGLSAVPIPLYPLELQNSFAAIVLKSRSIFEENIASRTDLNLLTKSLLSQAFTGELTRIWRDQNQTEMREAIAKRNEWLNERGVQRSVPTPTTVEQPFIPNDVLLARLSSTQQRVYAIAQNHPNPYFTLQTLWEEQEDNAPLDRDVVERGLSMLEALGVILKVSVPVSPTGEAFYQNVYRLAPRHPVEQDLRALKDRYSNIRL